MEFEAQLFDDLKQSLSLTTQNTKDSAEPSDASFKSKRINRYKKYENGQNSTQCKKIVPVMTIAFVTGIILLVCNKIEIQISYLS